MNPVVLDTHALVWLLAGDDNLGAGARRLADAAAREDGLLVSAISFWEVAMLSQRGRLSLTVPPSVWRRQALQLGVRESPVTGEIGVAAAKLEGFHPDPADRMIAATALFHGAVLVTADSMVLLWKGSLERLDARS